MDKERKRADAAEERLTVQQTEAHKEIEKERVEAVASVTADVRHDYKYPAKGHNNPFRISAIYHDDRFTYIEGTPSEPPALYEVKDGKDSLIQFEFDEARHRYTAAKILDGGYLRVGKKSFAFTRKPDA